MTNKCELHYCNKKCENLNKMRFFVDSTREFKLCCFHQEESLNKVIDKCDICYPKAKQMALEEFSLNNVVTGGW